MQTQTLRLLGCAFAAADLLFEIDQTHVVQFAAGASGRITGRGDANAKGEDWRAWIALEDRDMAEALASNLAPGERRGPVNVRLASATGACASLTAFSLPDLQPHVSCALTVGAMVSSAAFEPEGPNDLHDLEGFTAMSRRLADAAKRDGVELDLSLVELPQTGNARLEPEMARRIASILRAQSYGGASAACLTPNRFALLQPKREQAGRIADQLTKATGLEAISVSVPINPDWTTEVFLRTLRFTLDQFIKEGVGADPVSILSQFEARAADTDARAQNFVQRVQDRDFNLVYQPVVSLKTGAVGHYEVLARFAPNESPLEQIKFAEDLDLMEPFDFAVVETVINRLAQADAAGLKFAVNLSGRSILRRGFVERLLALLGAHSRLNLPSRLEFEITESAALDDLQRADRCIQKLRGAGFKVALDDFGAGANSFAYLRALHVDSVKIDGLYVRNLAQGGREASLIRHLTELCHELGVVTVAEMVETSSVEDLLKSFGVDFAQGYLYGKPALKPLPALPREAPRAARRMGVVETWG
ncbi:MAG: EAL domain-containing protein [Caulobacteraceae bacterium]